MHPGSSVGGKESTAIRRISKSINGVIESTQGSKVTVLLETTAGQGYHIGYRFEQLARIMENIAVPERVGICLDTCHIFAAGYEFSTKSSYDKLMESLESIIGLEHLKLIHMNDSKKERGSRVDRHEQIGLGKIGKKVLAYFLKDPRFAHLPFILETPKGQTETGEDWDRKNLETLENMMEE
jgi:deoxyribonuclease-4